MLTSFASTSFRFAAIFLIGSAVVPAYAQSPANGIEAGGHVSVLRLSEFNTTDAGVGVNVAWHVTPIVALDGALTWFPGDDTAPASARISNQQRLLGLVGARPGIRRGPLELFARARAGFLRFAPLEHTVCVAVTTVPPPLECNLATGYTAWTADLGGGMAFDTGHLRSGSRPATSWCAMARVRVARTGTRPTVLRVTTCRSVQASRGGSDRHRDGEVTGMVPVCRPFGTTPKGRLGTSLHSRPQRLPQPH